MAERYIQMIWIWYMMFFCIWHESHTNLPWKASVVICRSWWFWRIWHLLQALQMPFEFICSSFICLFTAWKNRLHRRSWLEDMIPEEFQILYSINLHLAMKKIQEFHRCYFEIISEKKIGMVLKPEFLQACILLDCNEKAMASGKRHIHPLRVHFLNFSSRQNVSPQLSKCLGKWVNDHILYVGGNSSKSLTNASLSIALTDTWREKSSSLSESYPRIHNYPSFSFFRVVFLEISKSPQVVTIKSLGSTNLSAAMVAFTSSSKSLSFICKVASKWPSVERPFEKMRKSIGLGGSSKQLLNEVFLMWKTYMKLVKMLWW